MLENIHVKNIALIKEIDINLSNGLNIITGETGAGKSLIIGSIAIGLGGKVDKDFISNGEDEALIELTFTDDNDEVKEILKNNCIDVEDSIIIQRKITKTRTVNRINYNSVSLAVLKEVGSKLMQIHGQHDNQILLNKVNHIRLLDDYAKDEIYSIKEEYQKKFQRLLSISNEIKELESLNANKDRDIDYCNFVVEEIEEVAPKLGEDEELREKYNYIVDLQNSYEDVNSAYNYMTKDVENGVTTSISLLQNIPANNKRAEVILENLNTISSIIDDINADLLALSESIDFDEEVFEKIDNRIDKLDNLKRKYGGSIEAVLEYRDLSKQKLDKINKAQDDISELKKEGIALKQEVQELAAKLTEIRHKKAEILSEKIIQNLQELNFLQVKFEIRINKLQRLNLTGQDDVEMLISTNVGYEPKPLASIASGGELARIMLAIESIISSVNTVNSMIFDEVDSGISGKTGMMVAKRLKEMSSTHQIICITHLPQLASVGDCHLKIEKIIKDNKTYTLLNKLNENESINEVARLLGGIDITQATINNAIELRNSLR